MPKEKLNYPNITEGPDGSMPLGPEVSLHWSSGAPAYAQISFEFDVKAMRDYLAQLVKDSPTDSRAIFYTEELTRHELQTTIRAAKRARDSVYEADE
jgi:hypothetical protein